MQDKQIATPPFMAGDTLSEIFATSAADAACAAFGLARLPRGAAPLFWVQDRISRQEAGLPYLPGLAGREVIRADLNQPVDVLRAMEEGLRCSCLAAVIGEIWGDPRSLDFTATKRLAMRAERYGVPCWLIRRAASPDLSAARDRWRVTSLPSERHPDDPKAPGAPRWQVELFRSRHGQTGIWIASYDRAANRLDLSSAFRDGAMAEDDGPRERRAAR